MPDERTSPDELVGEVLTGYVFDQSRQPNEIRLDFSNGRSLRVDLWALAEGGVQVQVNVIDSPPPK
jgi:hypothetical protein